MNCRKNQYTSSTGIRLNIDLKKINRLPRVNIALTFLFLVISTLASATDYYISSSGNDSNTGLTTSTPWKTIAKVNAAFSIMKPGDNILFNRGDTFYGSLIISKSGAPGSPITFGAYGTGEKPNITGFTTITGWTNEGNGIYSKVITSAAQTNMVTIDGINTSMGRYPNSTYLTYESFNTNISITDNQLVNGPNWTGTEAVIRKNAWTLDRCLITTHSGSTLTYKNLGTTQNATENHGYFIQNDLRTLDSFGEWYHDTETGKFYLYFGAVDPLAKTVKVATITNLVCNHDQYDFVTLSNLSLTGAIDTIVHFWWLNDYCSIQNCNISGAGGYGIMILGNYNTIDNNQISDVASWGINDSGSNNMVSNNRIVNIGLIGQTTGKWSGMCGILSEGVSNNVIQYNTIENTGYNGIIIGDGNNAKVIYNLINNTCLVTDDGGGIYAIGTFSSLIIESNIFLNCIGNNIGTSNNERTSGGIYLDWGTSGVTVRDNTVANCSYFGIKLHAAHDNIINHNTTFNNYVGIDYENWPAESYIYGNQSTENIYVAKENTQFSILFAYNVTGIPNMGISNNNYFARPISDETTLRVYQPDIYFNTKTLNEWQNHSGQDANSHKSSVSVSDTASISFYYNETKVNKTIVLANPMIDVKGTKYVNNIKLLPFTSAVLMVDPNPDLLNVPVYVSAAVGNTTPSLIEMTYNLSLANILPATSAFTVLVNSAARAVNAVAISGTKVQLTLTSAIAFGDVVTLAYTKPAVSPLQTSSAGQAASVSAQAVTNNINPPVPVYVSSAVGNTTPSQIEMTYNLGLANIVPAASAFTVLVNSAARAVNAVAISGTKVQLTLASAIVYGDVVTITYIKPAVSPLQTTSAGLAASINAQTVTNNCLKLVGGNALLDSFVDTEEKKLTIYPNPAHDFFNLSFDDPTVESQRLKIIDLSGKIVLTDILEQGIKNIQIPVNFKSGNYIITIESNGKVFFTHKLIINQ